MGSGIYLITNTATDKFYIGSSVNIHKRWICHKCDLRKNRHPNSHLQRSYNNNGIDVFTHSVIEYCDRSELKDREQYWIDKLYSDKCYNIFKEAYSVNGENHPMFGRSHTLEAKLKIKEARAKQTIKHSEETRQKIGAGNKGRGYNPEHIQKMIKARNGKAWNKGLKTGTQSCDLLSKELLAIIKVDYLNGKSINAIKNIYSLDWDRVKNELIKMGLKTRTISEQKIIKDNEIQ